MVALVDKIPQDFICPISQQIMKRAVITECNHSFDEEYIELSMKIKKLCPLDRKPIANLRPNAELQDRISLFKQQHPELISNDDFQDKISPIKQQHPVPDRPCLQQHPDPRDFRYCMKEVGRFFLDCFTGMPAQNIFYAQQRVMPIPLFPMRVFP